MPTLNSCPPFFELEQFLLGQLADEVSDVMEAHLDSCSKCQRLLPQLTAEDEFVKSLRTRSGDLAVESSSLEPGQDLVRLLVPHFKQIATAFDETSSFAVGRSSTDVPPRLDELRNRTVCDDLAQPRSLGRYEIQGVLGSGGMGTVLRGYDPLLKRSVAIKVIRAKLLADAGMPDRLVREAQAAAAVERDNIVAIYSVETHAGDPCIVMPLLRGMSLRQHLEENGGPLPVAEVLRIGRETASGLAAAHAVGLTHCDIKPANLWLEAPHGRVKVLDFGLAIGGNDPAGGLPAISGTPGFLAPEQARGLAVDQRADVFSLGCVLYLLATGVAPFSGEREFRSLWTVLSAAPPPASQLNPKVSSQLSNLIGRMLAQDPSQRPADAAAVQAAIAAIEQQISDRKRKSLRRRWLVAIILVAILSGTSVGWWGFLNAPAAVVPVEMTFIGDEPPLVLTLSHDGKEQTLTLGRAKTLELAPGDYWLQQPTDQPKRKLVPDRFTVVTGKPETLRIALVGEVAQHVTHTQPVTGVAIVPNSSPLRILSVGLDRALVAWEPASTKPPQFVNLPHAARCLAIAPHNKGVVTAGGNKLPPAELAIRLWDRDLLLPDKVQLAKHTRIVQALAFAPDGSQLASAAADGIFLWDLSSGEAQALVAGETSTVFTIAFSPDGRHLLTGNDNGKLTYWSLLTRAPTMTCDAGPSSVRAVAFLSDRWVSAGDDGTIRIWKEGKLQQEWLGNSQPVLTIAVSPDGTQLLSGDAEGILRVWSISSGQCKHVIQGHKGGVNSVAIPADGRQAISGGADGVVRLWQLPFNN